MKKILKYLAVIFGVIILDQVSKGTLIYLISGGVPLGGAFWDIVPNAYLMAHVNNLFNIVFTWNPGASFSILRDVGEAAPILIAAGTGVIIGFIGYYLFTRAARYEWLPLSLILGGAIGNLIDRMRFGAVVDFLDFHVGGWHWPAFNIADICIVVGVGLYLLNWYMARRRCIRGLKDEK